MKYTNIINAMIISLSLFGCTYRSDLEKLHKKNKNSEIIEYYENIVNKELETTSTIFVNESFIPFIISKQDDRLNNELEKYINNKLNAISNTKDDTKFNRLLEGLIAKKYKFIDKSKFVNSLLNNNGIFYINIRNYLKYMDDNLVLSVFFDKLDKPNEMVHRISNMKLYFDKLGYMKNEDYNKINNMYMKYLETEKHFSNIDNMVIEAEKTVRMSRMELLEFKNKPIPRESLVRGMIVSREETGIDMFPMTDITIADGSGRIKFGTHDKNLRNKASGDLISVYLIRIDGQFIGNSKSGVEERIREINNAQENCNKSQLEYDRMKSLDPKTEIEHEKEKLISSISEYKMKYQIKTK